MRPEASTLADRIEQDPEFHALARGRSRFAWGLSVAMMAIYFGFILLVAFAPKLLGQPVGAGVTTLGIPIGLGVMFAAFILSGIYVWRANGAFDAMTRAIAERAQ